MDTVPTDDGVHLWTSVSGRGTPLICCHGGPGLWDMFGDLAALLDGTARVVRWDQRGCGRSERCDGPWTTTRSVADLDAVRRHHGLGRVALLGHSWGAQLALAYALAHPERVSALVYLAGTGIGPAEEWFGTFRATLLARLGEDPGRFARWEELSGRRERSEAEERERAELRWSAEFTDRARAHEHARRMADPWFGVNDACLAALDRELTATWGDPALTAACRTLDVPVLILDGADDIRPRSAVDSLAEVLPRVRRVTLADAGHLPWTEDSEGVRAAVGDFLTSTDGGGEAGAVSDSRKSE